MATATNYLGTSTGLMWDTLLPGVVPVTLYVAVQDRVTEVAEDTVRGLLSVLVPHQTRGQLQLGQPQLSPSDTVFLLKCSVILAHCGGLTLAGGQVPTKATLSLPLLNWTGERKYNERHMG